MTYAVLVATVLLLAGGPVLFLFIALGMARHAHREVEER